MPDLTWLGGIAKDAGAVGSVILLLLAGIIVLISYGLTLRRSSRHEALDQNTHDRIITERDRAYEERDRALRQFAECDAERDALRLQVQDLTAKVSRAEANERRLSALEKQVKHLSDELREATGLIASQTTVIKHMERMLLQKEGGAQCQP